MGAVANVLIKKGIELGAKHGLKAVPGIGFAVTGMSLLYSVIDASDKANLESVRKEECCPHIEKVGGGFSYGGIIGAMDKIAHNNVTVFEATNNRGWYYHPRPDYRVLHGIQIFRWRDDGRLWEVERPGQSSRRDIIHCRLCTDGRSGQ